MKTTIFTLIALLTCAFSFAQTVVVTPEWVKNYSDRDNMTNIPSAIDANGNIYVTGSVRTISQNYNFATIKYNQSGDTLWVRKYNGIANNSDEAIAIVLDASGNIIVVGKSKNTNGNYDIVTIKYDPNGVQLFANIYNGPVNGDDIPTDVTVDNSGNIYTIGYSKQSGTFDSYITIKYSSNGTQSWLKTYNATTTGNNRATGVFWKNNRLFVSGYSYQPNGTYAVTTMSYHAGNGIVLWTNNYGSATTMPSTPSKIANFGNNIYVSGSVGTSSNMDYSLVCYTLNNGNQQWTKTYDGYGLNDLSTSLVSDNSGNVFITGFSLNTVNEYEYHTIKYNSSGLALWVNKYPIGLLNTMVNNKIAIDPYSMLYVCGEVKSGYSRDMLLYQLSQSGNIQWDETYNGSANGADGATDMVIDTQGRIFLTGQTQNNIAKFDYTTIKLSQSFVYKPIDLYNEPRQSSFDFIANKGQLVNTNNVLVPEIKYSVPNTFPSLYFTPTRLSYVFSKTDTVQSSLDTLHRIDMTFANCNQLARIFPIDTTNGFTNYFLPQCPQGITNVKGCERLFVPNIYPNIDLHYYSNNAGLKMYFVLKPGANPKDIAMLFAGQNNLQVNNNGELIITSSIGSTKFEQPHAYMVNYGQQIVPVNWQPQWQVNGNRANFTTGTWNGPFPLVIMIDEGHLQQQLPQANQNLLWSTYHTTGTSSNPGDFGFSVCNDPLGNIYTVGQVFSSNFPITSGSLPFGNGQSDGYLTKINVNYQHAFTTFIGGTGLDNAYDVAYNPANNLVYIVGSTGSNDIPKRPLTNPNNGTYYQNQNYANGESNQDAYIARFNSIGVPDWISYIGSTGNDKGKSIKILDNGDIYVALTTSTNTFENSCIAPVNGGLSVCSGIPPNGGVDIYLMKFNQNNQLIYSTFFGGSGDENVLDMTIGNSANYGEYKVYFVGYSKSPDFTDVSSGVTNEFTTSYQCCYNEQSGFIACINMSNTIIWSTLIPYLNEVQAVVSNNYFKSYIPGFNESVYIVGIPQDNAQGIESCSVETSGISICNNNGGYHQSQSNGIDDIYIANFINTVLHWSTFYGWTTDEGSDFFDITILQNGYRDKYLDCAIDNKDNLYVMGITSKSYGLTFTTLPYTGFYDDSYNDGCNNSADIFLLGFDSFNNIYWSTLFGGGDDVVLLPDYNSDFGGGMSILGDKLFLTGWTYNTTYPYECPGGTNPYCNQSPPSALGSVSTISEFDLQSAPIGVKENLLNDNDMNIFPNPTKETLFINSIKNNNINFEIFNSIGKKVSDGKYKTSGINVKTLPQGLYLIRLKVNKDTYSSTFIKQ